MTTQPRIITPDFKPQNLAEYGRAADNFAWWSHNLQLIKDKDADRNHLFLWNPVQWKLNSIVNANRNAFGGGRYIGLKARQMGFSTWCTARSAWKVDTKDNFRSLHVAHDGDGTSNMLDMVKLCHDGIDWDETNPLMLPDGNTVVCRYPEKAKNRNELRIRFDPRGKSESHARIKTAGEKGKVGRSASLNLLHISEAGNDVFDDGSVYGAAKQGLSQQGEVFVEGTADGAYGWYYNAWLKAKDEYKAYLTAKEDNPFLEYNGFVPIFFPWWAMPIYRIPLVPNEVITPDSDLEHRLMDGINTHDGHKCTPEQIKWMRYIMADMPESVEMTPEQWFLQEYACNDHDCFLTSGNSYFVQQYVDKYMTYAREYEKTHKIKRYSYVGQTWVADPYGPLRLTEEPMASATYVIGGDSAKGLSHGDFDTATIIKRVMDGPDEIVGYWRTHEPDKSKHAECLFHLGIWFEKALLAVENNPAGHGDKVCEFLNAMRYPKLYVQTFADEGDFKGRIKVEYGFLTTLKTKSTYLGDQQKAMRRWCESPHRDDGLICPFTAIVEEWRTYQKVDGKTEASKGSYDDLVISTAIANHLCAKVRATFRNKPKLGEEPKVKNITGKQFFSHYLGRDKANSQIFKLLKSK